MYTCKIGQTTIVAFTTWTATGPHKAQKLIISSTCDGLLHINWKVQTKSKSKKENKSLSAIGVDTVYYIYSSNFAINYKSWHNFSMPKLRMILALSKKIHYYSITWHMLIPIDWSHIRRNFTFLWTKKKGSKYHQREIAHNVSCEILLLRINSLAKERSSSICRSCLLCSY